MANMRCDACHALRWYGKRLQPIRVSEYPGPIERTYFVCEMCAEAHMLSLADYEYLPTMHRPHHVKQ